MAAERDDLPKHLEFIQVVIERHARTSFVLKGWSVTVVAAVFLLAVRGADSALAMAAGRRLIFMCFMIQPRPLSAASMRRLP